VNELIDDGLRLEDAMKYDLRLARAHNYRHARNLAGNVFAHLEISGLTHTMTSRTVDQTSALRGGGRVIELTTTTPWIDKDDEQEMRAVRIQHQEFPGWLGRLVFDRPQEPQIEQFALDLRPAGNNAVLFRHAVIEPGHPRSDRIVFPSIGLLMGDREERYESWHRRDLEVTDDLIQIKNHLPATVPAPHHI
jgi:hypothetical protein